MDCGAGCTCVQSGEVLLSGTPGYEFVDWGGSDHVGGGSHGSLHASASEGATSREISLRDGLVLAPLVACIVALALYPNLILKRGEPSVLSVTAAVEPEAALVASRETE